MLMKVSSRSIVLDLMVPPVRVKHPSHDHTLGQHTVFAMASISSEFHIFLDDGKGTFRLNAAMYPQLNTTIINQTF